MQIATLRFVLRRWEVVVVMVGEWMVLGVRMRVMMGRWIVDGGRRGRSEERGSLKCGLDKGGLGQVPCLLERTSAIVLMVPFLNKGLVAKDSDIDSLELLPGAKSS